MRKLFTKSSVCQFDRIDSVMKPKRPDRILNFKSVKLLKNENINFKWLFIARLEMALLKGSLSKGSIPGDSRLLRAFPKQLQAVPGGQAGKSTLAGNKKFISNSQNLMKSEKVHVQY